MVAHLTVEGMQYVLVNIIAGYNGQLLEPIQVISIV